MFVLRYWRTNVLKDNLLRISQYYVNSGARQWSESLNALEVNGRYDKFKINSYATLSAIKCWNCHTILDTKPCLFCKKCTFIQSPEHQNINYFELFSMHNKFDIDTGQLTSNFRKLQSLIHPDKFSNKTKEEKLLSESFSSLLNKAYRTLVNPLPRGLYMLNVHGFSIEEDSVTMDTQFLGEIMEWNEQVEEANTNESLEVLKKDIDFILINLYKEISKAFSENNLKEAKVLLSKAKYFTTLLEKIKETNV